MYLWRAVDSEGEVLDVLVQTKRNKAAALKLMRKLLKKYGFLPEELVTDDLRSYRAAARILGSSIGIAPADGETTGRRIRINRPDDENARCKVSRASDQHRDFFPFMQQSTTPSTFNAISFHQHIDLFGPRLTTFGATRRLLRRESRSMMLPRELSVLTCQCLLLRAR